MRTFGLRKVRLWVGSRWIDEIERGLKGLGADRCGTWDQVVVGIRLEQQDAILDCGRRQGA